MPQPSDFLGFWGIIGLGWMPTYLLAWIVVATDDALSEDDRATGMKLLLYAGVVSLIFFAMLLLGSLFRI